MLLGFTACGVCPHDAWLASWRGRVAVDVYDTTTDCLHDARGLAMDSPPSIESIRERRAKLADTGSTEDTPPAGSRTPTEKASSTRQEFTGPLVPLQFKLPQDLGESLKLLSIQAGKPMSELVLDALTSQSVIAKAWVSTRRVA